MRMKRGTHISNVKEVRSFVFEELVSRNGFVFNDVCISECHTYNAVTDECQKKFNTITGTFVFHRVSHHLFYMILSLSTAAEYVKTVENKDGIRVYANTRMPY